MNSRVGLGAIVMGALVACGGMNGGDEVVGSTTQGASDKLNTLEFSDPTGTIRTYSDNPKVMFKAEKISGYPFFTSIGTNGRACIHCHTPQDGWGISAADIRLRFTNPLDVTNPACLMNLASCPVDPNPANDGLTDPIFRTVDGSNSPAADVSTAAARAKSFSMLLTKGLIRVGIGIPAGAEFTLAAVDDPYGYASAAQLSLFRRPLPSTNLRLSPPSTNGNGGGSNDDGGANGNGGGNNKDGGANGNSSANNNDGGANANAKTAPAPTPVLTTVMWDGRETLPNHDIIADLLDQANGATLGHAQAIAGFQTSDLQSIVDFETGLHTAQNTDVNAGALTANGGNGGPDWLSGNQTFYVGINDVVKGDYQTGAPFSPNVFTIYSAWASATNAHQAQIARGEAIFNTKKIAITGVGGLSDMTGTCTTCHDSPNYGHHSVAFPLAIGVADGSRRTPDLPLYTLQNIATGQTVQVTDPGRALVTGKWADIGKFKGPILRGIASRAPYFHNGSAATVNDVVSFYQNRFGIPFTTQETQDLAAFLLAL